ncbi:MAG: hypothetical protein PVJ03_08815 [Chromatiaceae bacterium]|jgi:hypothetical protein
MSLNTLTQNTVEQIRGAVGNPLSESEIAAIKKIVDTALINAVNQSTKKCTDAAVIRCGPEADLAHKIAEDVERARYALIGNLTSMR